jgi:hypothetical protein
MIDLKQVTVSQQESTGSADAILRLEEGADSAFQQGVVPQALRPVGQVSIIRAGSAAHLHVAQDEGGAGRFQHMAFLSSERPASALVHCPIFPCSPPGCFVRGSVFGPCPHLSIELAVASTERGLCNGRAVIVGPASDDRGEFPNQRLLRGVLVCSDDVSQCSMVSLDGFSAGCNEGLKSQGVSSAALSGVGFSNRILPDCKPQARRIPPLVPLSSSGCARFWSGEDSDGGVIPSAIFPRASWPFPPLLGSDGARQHHRHSGSAQASLL